MEFNKYKTDSLQSKYTVRTLEYPEDVGTSPDLKHTMVFFINIRGNSQYRVDDDVQFEISDAPIVTKSGIIKGAGLTAAITTAAASGKSIASSGMHKILSGANVIQSVVSSGKKVAGVAAASAVGALTVSAAAAVFEPSKMFRLKDAIKLAIQEPLRTSYHVKYDEYDAGTMIGAMSSTGITGELAKAGLLNLAKIPNAVGAPDFAKGIQKMSGTSLNPFKSVLFNAVDLRTFSYNYKFMPKSKKEALYVREIIQTFKFHMHPKFSKDKVFLIHPSEFNIVYYYNGKETENWHKISTCVLTHMEVDNGTEQLASFEDGMSVEVNMKLTFMETEMMTKERIAQGY